MTWRTTSM
ncbi:hypothetical protein LINPERHAP1_LOCUS19249 [Linum perenne]